MAARLRLIKFHLNSAEEKRLCRSPCSLFWARSLLCWEILFQEANRIWHPEPIFSNSHLAAWSAGSTTASDNTSLLDKFFCFCFFFNIFFFPLPLHIEDLIVLPPLLMKGLDCEWRRRRWWTSIFPRILFWADRVSRSPTWGYFWLPSFLHALSTDLYFSSGAPHYYWQASQQLWKHTAYVEQLLRLHSQTEFSGRQETPMAPSSTRFLLFIFVRPELQLGSWAGLIVTTEVLKKYHI